MKERKYYPTVICVDCTSEEHHLIYVDPIEIDFGIGSYECHGRCGVDIDIRVVCPVCETNHFLNEETFDEIELTAY